MKTLLLSVTCAAGLAATAQAQIFRPQVANDVLIGGVAGAIIGDNNHHRALEGAAIGAAAGYLWGVATTPPQSAYAPPVPVAVYPAAPVVYEEAPTLIVGRPAYAAYPPRVVYRRGCYPVRHVVHGPVYWRPGYYAEGRYDHDRHGGR